jgi:hypothetical protein
LHRILASSTRAIIHIAVVFIPQVALPKTTTFLADRVFIDTNWDDKLAAITDSDEDVFVRVHKLFIKARLLNFNTARDLAKSEMFKDRVHNAGDLPLLEAGANSKTGQQDQTDASAQNHKAKKRKLGLRLSDVEVPPALLWTPKAKKTEVLPKASPPTKL